MHYLMWVSHLSDLLPLYLHLFVLLIAHRPINIITLILNVLTDHQLIHIIQVLPESVHSIGLFLLKLLTHDPVQVEV